MRLLSKVRLVASRHELHRGTNLGRQLYPQVDEQRSRLPQADPLCGVDGSAVEQRLVQLVEGDIRLIFIWLKRREKGSKKWTRRLGTFRFVPLSFAKGWGWAGKTLFMGRGGGGGSPASEEMGARAYSTCQADRAQTECTGDVGSPQSPCVPRGWQEGPISEAHQGTVNRKVLRLDGLQLIQHFADDDHACPDSADTRSQTAQLGVRQSESPGNQKYIVEQRHLKIESQKWGQEFPSCLSG